MSHIVQSQDAPAHNYPSMMPINEQTKKIMILYQKTSFSNQKENDCMENVLKVNTRGYGK
jgi:hypothetical protein